MFEDGSIRLNRWPGFEPVFESLHSWSICGGWDFIPNLGGTVAEGTPTKVSCYSWNIADWTSAGFAWAHKETEVNVDKQVGVWIESCR